ncbi:MAG: hypothetical protein JRJ26_02485, partial [Deltaproteobacteria bacterium]|nr:hypothetical protein [Deltaproteobacteria bacterium]
MADKKIEDMIKEEPEKGKPKLRGKIRRGERLDVMKQMAMMLRLGYTPETVMTVLRINRRQYNTLLRDIKKARLEYIEDLGMEYVAETVEIFNETVKEALQAAQAATGDTAKCGFLNTALK